MKNVWSWMLAVIGLAFAATIGLWSQSLFTQSESIHFSVNYPAGLVVGEDGIMDCCDLGGPWARVKQDEDWAGYPSGGVLVWGTEGCIVLDVGKEGLLKRTLQPGLINLSTHWLRNVGTKPYQIRLDMDMCGMELEWETHEAAWDAETRTSTRKIEPGKVFNMDWYLHIPPELFDQAVVCEGQLAVFDAETDLQLTMLPIKIINSRTQ